MGDITVGDGTGGTAARLTPHRLGRTRVHTSHTLLLIPCVHFIVRVLRCVFSLSHTVDPLWSKTFRSSHRQLTVHSDRRLLFAPF